MEVPESCQPCIDKQIRALESAGTSRAANLCPLLALLAMKQDRSSPLIERHFLNLSEACADETHGDGGLYRVQRVQGERAVQALVAIKQAIEPEDAVALAA